MTRIGAISPDSVRHTMADALRVLIGQGRRYSLRQIVEATGIGESTMKGYLRGDAEPGVSQFLKLCAVLGPAFASEMTRMAGLEMVEVEAEPVSTGELMACNANLLARTAETLRTTDRMTHRTDADIRPLVEEVVTLGRHWLANRPRCAFSRRRPANDDAPGVWARLREWSGL